MSASLSLPGSEHHEFRIVMRAIAMSCGVMLIGTVGFMVIDPGWTLWRAIYFTLITITTVGFTDEGISEAGQKFAALLLVIGIGTATWTLTTVVQYAVSYQFDWQRRMKKMIKTTSDHIIICGFGRIGQTICKELAESEIPCVVIDRDEDRIAEVIACGYMAVIGDTTDDQVLREAGLERARGIVCVTSSDAENVFITLTAREINPSVMIASRANAETSARRMEHARASLVVSPFLTAGVDLARAIVKPHLAELLRNSQRTDSDFALSEVLVESGSRLEGQTPRTYGQEEDCISFIAIKREGEGTIYRPGGKETFRPHDIIIAAGVPDALARMSKTARPLQGKQQLVHA
jgi:voltage-gated potassium channel